MSLLAIGAFQYLKVRLTAISKAAQETVDGPKAHLNAADEATVRQANLSNVAAKELGKHKNKNSIRSWPFSSLNFRLSRSRVSCRLGRTLRRDLVFSSWPASTPFLPMSSLPPSYCVLRPSRT